MGTRRIRGRTCRDLNRVREANFSLEGLVGFDLFGKVCGIVGTGRIGAVVARIMREFGCRLLAFDLRPNRGRIPQRGIGGDG
jgi:D-lactate dehydrogenase